MPTLTLDYDPRRARHVEPFSRRCLHLLDLENAAGGPKASPTRIREVWEMYRYGVPSRPGDQFVIASCRLFAATTIGVLPTSGVRYVWRDGVDGADRALLDQFDDDLTPTRYGRLAILSGDGIFAALALTARRRGMHVQQVSGLGGSSRVLLEAAHSRTWLRLTR